MLVYINSHIVIVINERLLWLKALWNYYVDYIIGFAINNKRYKEKKEFIKPKGSSSYCLEYYDVVKKKNNIFK